MDTLIDLLLFLLIAIAVLPLLWLALYALASHFELRGAEILLDGLLALMKLQWLTAGIVNIFAGFALAALGVWAVLHFDTLPERLLCVVLVPFGVWRVLRGTALLKAMRESK